jgi:nicotinic acid mononucleotide adenylyltransferase
MPAMDLSSTLVRARLAAGRSVRYLVPAAVEAILAREWSPAGPG